MGVPRPVQPKSQMQRSATANPRTEGMAASQRQRRTLAKVDECIPAVGQVDRHEATAAEIAATRVSHSQRIAHRDGGIDGIAALGKNVRAGLGSERVFGGDDAVA